MSLRLWFWTILTGSRHKGLLLEGRRLLKMEQLTSALQHFREVAETWPDRLEGYEGLEQTYRAMGLLEESQRESQIAMAMKALKDNPADLEARLRLVRGLVDKQMYKTALSHAELILKASAKHPEGLRLVAVVLRYNRLVDRALEVVNSALSLDPLSADLYEQQAFCLRALNRQLEASQAVSVAKALQAVSREPSNQDNMERAIFQLSVVKRRRQGLRLVERSLESYPQATGLLYLRGQLLMEDERYKEALANLLQAVALEPTRGKTHALLSSLYLQLGQQERAAWHQDLADLLERARRSLDRVDADILVAEALLKVKQVEQAEEKVLGLCRQYPQDWRCFAALGLVRKEQERVPEALSAYRQAARMADKEPEPLMAMAWIHAAAGQPKEAVYVARQAVAVSSRNPGMRRQMADLFQQLGFSDLAKEERALAEAMEKSMAARGDD